MTVSVAMLNWHFHMPRVFWIVVCLLPAVAYAQKDRISGPIDTNRRTILRGTAHPLAVSQQDQGPVEPSFTIHALLHLRPSGEQLSELRQFLDRLQNPSSPLFRKFISPEDYADRFGVSAADINRIRSWLQSQGFAVGGTARGRTWIQFSATADQIVHAFGTEIHRYRAADRLHYANVGSISLPSSIADVTLGITGLDDFHLEPHIRIDPDATNASGTHSLAPDDIATIYDIARLYQEGIDGTGQKIAIIGARIMNVTDINAFRSRFNLPSKTPQTVLVPGFPDPGANSAWSAAEVALDVEWSGAVARNADLLYVYSSDPLVAFVYAISENLAPVVSLSAGVCELRMSASALALYQQVTQQANAQGITLVNSSGDAGPSACDPNGYPMAQNGLAVSFPANIPEVTAVGGTQFDETAGSGNYWNIQNDANGASALTYIPEKAWNETGTLRSLWAGGGGASVVFPKPAWQAGLGVPNDGARDVPDLALSAAGHDGYMINASGVSTVVSGTSAAAPVFAGIMALLNQSVARAGVQPRVGNINPGLYSLMQSNPDVFHDIVTGGNSVPCAPGSPNCTNGTLGYSTAPGYDLATGLGSPDVYKLVHAWTPQPSQTSQIVVSLSQNPVYQQPAGRSGLSWSVTITLAEEAGIPTTLTDFTVDGQSQIDAVFPQRSIPALGHISAIFGYATLNVPATINLRFAGADAGGVQWSRTVSVPFLASPPLPGIGGVGNNASGDNAYAPGMLVSVYGSNFTTVTQAAAVVPLETYLGGLSASINGVACPLFFVSPNQINLQIPYETPPGRATLSLSTGSGSAIFSLTIAPTAPGIFQDKSKSIVPNASGNRGQIYTLFITGEGAVSPAVADGSAPIGSVFPVPRNPVSMTIGGIAAEIKFIGIPGWAVGLTQINFQVPSDAPLGPQQVVVKVGNAAGSPANFTVLP